jgi:hypothetical protein
MTRQSDEVVCEGEARGDLKSSLASLGMTLRKRHLIFDIHCILRLGE